MDIFLSVFLVGILAGVATAEPLRMEVELRRLNNSLGILKSGEQCDLTSACDMRLTGYLDIDAAMNAWPGSKPEDSWVKIVERDNENAPVINKIVSRDDCVGRTTRANLRIKAVDVDSLTANDLVDNFECMVPVSGSNIATSISRAQWSTEKFCDTKYNPGKITLKFRYRVFLIDPADCGRPPVGATAKV
ncbi:hypothetical protein RvY_12767 [Ramazzottius varieornatus]|uniref:Uncharacterized protein n=1 Tax=Ramazzottius varieornatus TaxID=947166 RepID=A0A1D1VKM9_RAMVA|nr:hypothetical protein RvY_12767 [Ramazzottius varieornatus]